MYLSEKPLTLPSGDVVAFERKYEGAPWHAAFVDPLFGAGDSWRAAAANFAHRLRAAADAIDQKT